MGPYLGGGLALIGGAYVIEWVGEVGRITIPVFGDIAAWQFTFMAVAAPGALIAAWCLTLREPLRRNLNQAVTQAAPAWSEVGRFVRSEARIYFAVLVGVPFLIVILYGLQGWVPTILVRVYGWELADAGRIYGIVALVAGSVGVFTGPLVGRLLQKRGHQDYPLRLAAFSAVAIVVSMASLPWAESGGAALIRIGAASFFVTLPLALMTYIIQMVSPANMRGVLSGCYVVGTNVLGLGLGPTLVATSTDFLFADPAKVHLSLTLVSVCVAPIALLLFLSGMSAFARWQKAQLADAA